MCMEVLFIRNKYLTKKSKKRPQILMHCFYDKVIWDNQDDNGNCTYGVTGIKSY